MSGAVVVTPSTGQSWATAWEQVEGMRKGAIALSLTNYDATAVPQIAAGSWVEAIGSIYKWAGNDNVVGGLTNDAINYVTMVPSGAGAGAILTPTWSDTPPTWSDAYNGYFDGTTRYVGGCYYDGANYLLKWVYTHRRSGIISRTIQVSLSGFSENIGTLALMGDRIDFLAAADGVSAFLPIPFPRRYYVTGLVTYCAARTEGTALIYLNLCGLQSAVETTMANTAHNGIGEQSDTTITTPIIDQDTYKYYIRAMASGQTSADITQVEINGYEIIGA